MNVFEGTYLYLLLSYAVFYEYEEKSTEKNTLHIISGVIGGAALLLGLLAALLFFERKPKMPISGDGFERTMTDFPSSPSLNTGAW